MYNYDEDYCLEQFKKLIAIDSTTGQYEAIQDYVVKEIENLGFDYSLCHKGGVIADLGGQGDSLVITAHCDDIGLMVRRINEDGTLNVCPVGGLYTIGAMMENVRVYTFDGEVHTGSVWRTPNSIHVTEGELRDHQPDYRKDACVRLDADVTTAQDVKDLGIEVGNMIALDPRCVMTNGYIKSRFIDDKACVAILLAVMKYIKDNQCDLPRNVKAYFAMFEEVGHGTAWLPEETKDLISIDIAPTGPDQTSDEHKVTIIAKDSRFPYHEGLTKELRQVAKDMNLDFVMDVMTPHYGTDGDGSILAGHDIRHGAFGPGTANSHAYERTHLDGLKNTYLLTLGYIFANAKK